MTTVLILVPLIHQNSCHRNLFYCVCRTQSKGLSAEGETGDCTDEDGRGWSVLPGPGPIGGGTEERAPQQGQTDREPGGTAPALHPHQDQEAQARYVTPEHCGLRRSESVTLS